LHAMDAFHRYELLRCFLLHQVAALSAGRSLLGGSSSIGLRSPRVRTTGCASHHTSTAPPVVRVSHTGLRSPVTRRGGRATTTSACYVVGGRRAEQAGPVHDMSVARRSQLRRRPVRGPASGCPLPCCNRYLMMLQ
jgi:hypothetical protein